MNDSHTAPEQENVWGLLGLILFLVVTIILRWHVSGQWMHPMM